MSAKIVQDGAKLYGKLALSMSQLADGGECTVVCLDVNTDVGKWFLTRTCSVPDLASHGYYPLNYCYWDAHPGGYPYTRE